MLLGRVTYSEFASHLPRQEGEMADTMNGSVKYIVSQTLDSADWQNTTVINGDVTAQITALKQRDGKNIGMTGSGTLVRSLLRTGLLDELHLFMFPVVLGEGKHLFSGEKEQLALTLAGAQTYPRGVLHLTYGKA